MENQNGVATDGKKLDDMFNRFDTIPACDRQTDRHLATAQPAVCIGHASRGKGSKIVDSLPPVPLGGYIRPPSRQEEVKSELNDEKDGRGGNG